MRYFTEYKSPIGTLVLLSDGESLSSLLFDRDSFEENGFERKLLPVFETTYRWLDIYFSGKAPDFIPPLKLEGTDFRIKVWKMLLDIPYGKLITYGELAKKLSDKMSSRAIGGAVGHNNIPIIIPCHRVIGTNGNLTGFTGGMDKKIALLSLEGVDMTKLHKPKRRN